LSVKPFEGGNAALSGTSNAEAAKVISEAKKRGQEKAQEGLSALVAGGWAAKTSEIITEALQRPVRRFPPGARNTSIMCPCIGTK